jgi:gliding motility-associated-like protein
LVFVVLQKVKNHILALTGLFIAFTSLANGPHIFFTPNEGQWHPNVKYMLGHGNGNLFLEKNSLTWFFYDPSALERIHGHQKNIPVPDSVKVHSLKVKFEGAEENPELIPAEKTSFYSNYFLGNDPNKWASNVWSYQEMTYQNIYSGIHLKFYESGEQLKYDFIVTKGADASKIKMHYQGADEVRMTGDNLFIRTTVTNIIEEKPYAFQIINGIKKEVPCRFQIDKNKKVSFLFPEGYDEDFELIIDPILLFSTFTGSTANNFGFTATYDDQKNTYVGGIVYSSGNYPTTVGAFQLAWAGGFGVDIGISKLNTTGTGLIYSTYIGGNDSDAPHSLVTNSNGELFILGTTGSSNFPVTPGCFDNSFNGGPNVSPPSSGMVYSNGSDIIVTHLNATGSALIGSTYLGGTDNDGLNLAFNLAYNYGDAFRGEIIVDAAGNCLIASTTNSSNFPTTALSPLPTALGGTDGVVCRLNSTLSSLTWSTYFGGNSNDSAYGIQLDSNQEIYVSGGTESTNIPVTPGALFGFYGNMVDGYIVRFSSSGNSILACTYIGTPSYDQTYFVQLDTNDDVYVVGQTNGNYPITAGTYNNPNSGQFIQKVNKQLTTSLMSTRIGRGTGQIDISPSAFLVNVCGHIYLSGWGGTLNGLYLADFSGTSGLPTTPDAVQPNTDGNDFYLMVLDADAAGLLYASFLGGGISGEHVDGGTSRFDKDGVVYQAVCAGCQNNDDFPTTPGAWSNTNNSSGCNLAVFKFDLAPIIAETHFEATTYCTTTVEIIFDNVSQGTINSYYWDFGDGTTSTEENPIHEYTAVGNYTVMLVVEDSNICNGIDTTFYSVVIPPPPVLSVMPNTTICEGDSVVLDIAAAGGDLIYSWTPDDFLSSGTDDEPFAFPIDDTEYIITITDTNGCEVSDTIIINVNNKPEALFNSQITPCSLPFTLDITNSSMNGFSYLWDFGDGNSSTLPEPQHIYDIPGIYTLTLIAYDSSFCAFSDTMTTYIIISPLPSLNVMSPATICEGDSIVLEIDATGVGLTYQWTPNSSLSSGAIEDPIANPNTNTEYEITITDTNGCSLSATIPISVNEITTAFFEMETTPCELPFTLTTTNGSGNAVTYFWDFGDGTTSTLPNPQHVYNIPGNYLLTMIAYDSSFCAFSDTAISVVNVFAPLEITVSEGDSVCIGSIVPMSVNGGETYQWFPASAVSNPTSQNPNAIVNATTNYMVIATDANGCIDTGFVNMVIFPPANIDAGPDQIYGFGPGMTLNPNIPDSSDFYWTPPTGLSCTDCLNPVASPDVTTLYYLYYTDEFGCTFMDSILVQVSPTLYVPNAFTPNGDDKNNVFKPVMTNLDFYEFFIFDRWGQLILQTTDTEAYWDGTFKGIKCPVDVYVWKINYSSELEPNVIKEIYGHVTLIR